jgi:MurNAc alpha-1-phosphate uridylyltransferase
MKGMIFSAGLGTRFKPWTDLHPKALAPVNGKSLLQRNIEYFKNYGISDVVVNVHHFADQVIDEIEKNKGWGTNIEISDEKNELLETGGGLLKAKKYFNPGERFITTNTDILTDLSIDALVDAHEKTGAFITLSVTGRKTSRYLLFDKSMRLSGWRNTKTSEERIVRDKNELDQKAYSCVVIFEYDIFRLMEEAGFKGKFSLIDVYLRLAANYPIMGFDHSGDRLVDVGKPESIGIAESLFP